MLSDIAQSGLTDDELTAAWREWSRGQASATLVGIGPKLKRYAALFGCDREFYASTDECIARISPQGRGQAMPSDERGGTVSRNSRMRWRAKSHDGAGGSRHHDPQP